MCILGSVALADTTPEPPSDEALAEISARGKRLAAYDEALRAASEALAALKPGAAQVNDGIVRQLDDGSWRVVWGKRTESDDVFLISYEATRRGASSDFVVAAKDPPARDTDYFLRASRVLDIGLKSTKAVDRAFRHIVLPAEDGSWLAYVYPVPTDPGAWIIGGDALIAVAADGRSVTQSRQLHRSIVELPKSDAKKRDATVHTHVLDCIPGDTDVLAVLSQEPKVTSYIMCDPFSFAIDPDGTVRYLGLSEELWGRKKKDEATPDK